MLKKVLPTAMALVLASGVCAAQTEQSKKGFFLGGGINTIDTDSDIPEPDNYFVQAGYGFSESWSVELQYSDSYKAGNFASELEMLVEDLVGDIDVDIDVSKADLTVQTTSVFLAYRSTGAFYWKAKAGYMDLKSELDALATITAGVQNTTESFSESNSESGWAAGAGFGYSFGSSAIELEYLTTDDNVGIDSIALSYNYWF